MMAFLAIAGNAVWGQTTEVNLNDHQNSAYPVTGNGTYHITGSNSKGIQIERGSNATIILEDVSITGITNVAIEVNGGAHPTFILKGENKIESENGPAIRVGRDAEGNLRTGIIFSEQSTGSLIVDANGNVGIGINRGLPAGDITINGGTIIIDGIIRDGTSRDRGFNMNGNAVVIVDEIDWHDKNISSGILFEKSTTGQMYGNVTLNSPLDLTDNDLTDKLDLRGGTLTIGDKNSLKRDATEDVDGGTAVAFVANYNENSPASCSATDAKQDYTLYGTNTEIILQTEYPTCNNNTHQSLGWTKGENPTSVEGTTITTDASYPSQTTNNIELNAAWVEIAKTISAEEDKAIPTENNYNKLVVYPSSLDVTFKQTGSTSVNGVTFADGALTGTPARGTEGEYEYTVTVTCGDKSVDATMTLDIKTTPQLIEHATIELASKDGFTYNGAEQYPIVLKVDGVEVPKEEQFIFENHHEPIISKEIFNLAQEIRNKKSRQNTSGANTKRNYYFSGMCVCNDCGSGMSGIMIKRKVAEKGYDCSKYRQFGTKACHCHEVKEKDILNHLKAFLKFTKQKYLEEIKSIKIEIKQDKKENNKYKLQNKLNILNEEYKILVNQKVKELASANNKKTREITENIYKELEKDKMQNILYLQDLLEKDEKENWEEKISKLKTSIDYFDEIINSELPNRMILQMLIDKIYIDRDRTIKFGLKVDINKMI